MILVFDEKIDPSNPPGFSSVQKSERVSVRNILKNSSQGKLSGSFITSGWLTIMGQRNPFIQSF